MDRLNFEPFGEPLIPAGNTRGRSRVSKYLLWTGTGIFWSLVAAIVLVRALFFEPGIYDSLSRVAALATSLIF